VISQQITADQESALSTFNNHVQVARTALRNDLETLHFLQIQQIATKTWEWPRQALHFYTKTA